MSLPAREERWLHSVPSPQTASVAPWHDRERPRLLDAPVVFDLRSRARWAGAEAHDLEAHRQAYGLRPSGSGAHGQGLLEDLRQVALTGRGGGHFPVATKWRAALAGGGGGVVVANGAEGEPASAKDAAILQLRPHLVLDGLVLAAEVVGAPEGVVWLHSGDLATQRAVAVALAERRSNGELAPRIRIVLGPDHYLTGESSAVVRGLSGRQALPYLARTPAARSGVNGRPTLIHNAETLARVALVARSEPVDGPLVTLVGANRRVVVALSAGETFGSLLSETVVPQAVLVGGYGGTWLPWSEVATAEISETALRALGASLGAGVIAPLPPGACGLAETARVAAYLAASSARQCGPCMFGLPAIAELARALAAGRASRGDVKTLRRYAGEVTGRGGCHHPDGAVRLVWSALRAFPEDTERHLKKGPCPGSRAPALLPVPEVV